MNGFNSTNVLIQQSTHDAKRRAPLQSLDPNTEHTRKSRRRNPPKTQPPNPPSEPSNPTGAAPTPSERNLPANSAGHVNIFIDPPTIPDRINMHLENTGDIDIHIGNTSTGAVACQSHPNLHPVMADHVTFRPRQFLRAGKNSQDGPETAKQRKQIAAVQRRHRAQLRDAHRQNEVIQLSQTPPLRDLQPSPQPSSWPPPPIEVRSLYFACVICGVLRASSSAVGDENPLVCIYCLIPDQEEFKYCRMV